MHEGVKEGGWVGGHKPAEGGETLRAAHKHAVKFGERTHGETVLTNALWDQFCS